MKEGKELYKKAELPAGAQRAGKTWRRCLTKKYTQKTLDGRNSVCIIQSSKQTTRESEMEATISIPSD